MIQNNFELSRWRFSLLNWYSTYLFIFPFLYFSLSIRGESFLLGIPGSKRIGWNSARSFILNFFTLGILFHGDISGISWILSFNALVRCSWWTWSRGYPLDFITLVQRLPRGVFTRYFMYCYNLWFGGGATFKLISRLI